MDIQLFDSETGKPAGSVEVPDDVLKAAALVEAWLREHNCIALHGVMLADDH